MIFSDSDLEAIDATGEENLAWAVFEPIDTNRRIIKWHLYDNRTEMGPSGLPQWSIADGQSYKRETAQAEVREAYRIALEYLDKGTLWTRVDHYVKPAPKSDPEPESAPEAPAPEVESFTTAQEVENDDAILDVPQAIEPTRGFLRRRRADTGYQL